jgi:ABC-2 type transport system permease protein
MTAGLLKWSQTIQIAWSKYTAYRLNFFLQILGPAIVFFFIKYNLWHSIYGGDSEIVIGVYTLDQMITYHAWALLVGLLAQGHTALNLSEEIRLGKISSYLVYPFNFWEFHTAHFLAFQLLQLFVAALTLFLIVALGILPFPPINFLLIGTMYCLFVSLFWFAIQYFTGILGFWLEETWILRVILSIIVSFLSGAIIPLDLYPESFVRILNYTPFPYLTYYPIRLFMGEVHNLSFAYGSIAIWIILFAWINHLVWKRGIRMYTAAGM